MSQRQPDLLQLFHDAKNQIDWSNRMDPLPKIPENPISLVSKILHAVDSEIKGDVKEMVLGHTSHLDVDLISFWNKLHWNLWNSIVHRRTSWFEPATMQTFLQSSSVVPHPLGFLWRDQLRPLQRRFHLRPLRYQHVATRIRRWWRRGPLLLTV